MDIKKLGLDDYEQATTKKRNRRGRFLVEMAAPVARPQLSSTGRRADRGRNNAPLFRYRPRAA
jgi:hypothetical protein